MRIFKSTPSVIGIHEDFSIEFKNYRLWIYRLGPISFSPILDELFLSKSENWEEI